MPASRVDAAHPPLPLSGTCPDHIVNGSFEYPEDLKFIEGATWSYNIVDPIYGWGDEAPAASYGPIANFDRDKFGWVSNFAGEPAWNTTSQSVQYAIQLSRDPDTHNHFSVVQMTGQSGTSIYQDLRLRPGHTYRWHISETSQTNSLVDQMQVLIGPYGGSQDPQQATRVTSNGHGDLVGPVGTIIATTTTNGNQIKQNGQWEDYEGTYTVPEGQSIIRMTFKSLDSQSTSNASFIDNVGFGESGKLTYDPNGGNGTLPTGVSEDKRIGACAVDHPYGVPLTLPTAAAGDDCWDTETQSKPLARESTTFAGWSTTKCDPFNSLDEAKPYLVKQLDIDKSQQTVYAVWVWKAPVTGVHHTVLFKTQWGGSETTFAMKSVGDGAYATLPNDHPTRDGYDFTGWYTSVNPITGAGDEANKFTPGSTPITADTTLYAGWTPKPTPPADTVSSLPFTGGGSSLFRGVALLVAIGGLVVAELARRRLWRR